MKRGGCGRRRSRQPSSREEIKRREETMRETVSAVTFTKVGDKIPCRMHKLNGTVCCQRRTFLLKRVRVLFAACAAHGLSEQLGAARSRWPLL